MATNQPVVTFKEYPVNAGGLTLNCREAGIGLPVIFLESLRWGNQSFYGSLARNFHLFILELPGVEAEGVEQAVREAAEILAGDAYNLAGASRGANVALRTVLRAPRDPEPVESLVLLSPTAVRPANVLADRISGPMVIPLACPPRAPQQHYRPARRSGTGVNSPLPGIKTVIWRQCFPR